MNPIDVIANAVRAADGSHTLGAGRLAEVAAAALTDERVVDHAVGQLLADGWGEFLSGAQLQTIAAAVLGSVGGAS
ncbi:hypothetical protein ACFFX1_55660 [Dactylosporangium sucinum]|uniref:Uncharacterized protein n=1 Tax=Dactylosporangium sucinum TaxID=1424081 RepID=A0A917U2N3_9ACTN|nr:hypothetical protein [Dactylosporangium sucinum]GGM52270.1 hypothetical protein GCM10007977_062320 [Dactylosporangium sucinum]